MGQVDGMFCKLCLQDIVEKNFHVIEEVALKALAFLLLNVSLDESENYMCNDCSEKLFAAFDFKVMCLDTEDTLLPYIDSEKAWQVDLRDAYLKVKGESNVTVISDQQICRLCMCIVHDGFKSLKELCDGSMLDKYIPEVNFSITKDPVVCKQCWNALGAHTDSLRKWTNVEMKIKTEVQDPDDCHYIKSEEIDVVLKEDSKDEKESLHELNEDLLKSGAISETQDIENLASTNVYTSHTSGPHGALENCPVYNSNDFEAISTNDDYTMSQTSVSVACQLRRKNASKECMYTCDTCCYQSKYKNNFKQHLLIHKDPSEVRMFKCDKCDFQSKRKSCLVTHQIKHKDPLEIKMYKCEMCQFETKWKHSLEKHHTAHENNSELQIYKCEKCDFEAKWRWDLEKHLTKHEIATKEKKMYKCGKCDYQSKRKSCVQEHQIMHKDLSEIQMYKCDKCDFECKRKTSLDIHQTMHKDPSEVRMYKCDKCEFQTKWRCNFKQHHVAHLSASEVRMYKCDKCDYQTKWNNCIRKHQLIHKDSSEVQTYKCDKCNFQSRSKRNVLRHQLRHKDASEVQMYKCDKCDYETKLKHNLKSHHVRRHSQEGNK